MVGSHRDPGVLWDDVEKPFEYPVQPAHGIDLPFPEGSHLGFVEEAVFVVAPRKGVVVQMLEYTVNAADPGPLVLGFVGSRIWVVGLPGVQDVEAGSVRQERSSGQASRSCRCACPSDGTYRTPGSGE
ncbi:MAG: hypothetical protein MZV64_37085 [Ignavibacteriales bacterium]|nr:hypothetical protein [Ignavibacteriales bacterium]